MSDQHLAAARVAVIINEAERAMDDAMARASLLVAELPQLQQQAGLNAAWAQPAVASVCSALSDMTTARGSLIAAHKSLSAVQRKLGVTVSEVPGNSKEEGPTPAKTAESENIIRLRA
jgi:hypothetical protein